MPCGWFIHPSRPICPRCRGRDLDRRRGRAAARGCTATRSTTRRWFPGQPVPYVIGLVELVEQAGLRLTTNIVNCPPERLAIGMPLRVVFEILNDDVALPLFEPEEAA